SDNNTITNCTIENNGTAGISLTDSLGNEAHHNNIVGNTIGINNASTFTVDATLNWWGTTNIVFINNSIAGEVYAEPWLDAPYLGGESVDYWSIIEALESAVDNLMDRVGVFENGVETLENELETLRSRVDALENDTDNLLAWVGALETEVAVLSPEVPEIRDNISALDSRISELDVTTPDVLAQISELENAVVWHEAEISSLEYRATDLESSV
ncbi:unnamed protein product, partial [marine sediment metagenome]